MNIFFGNFRTLKQFGHNAEGRFSKFDANFCFLSGPSLTIVLKRGVGCLGSIC